MQIEFWQQAERQKTALLAALTALRDGSLVAFPTETVYVAAASAWHDAAAEQLSGSFPMAWLAFDSARNLSTWLPRITEQEFRLARKCWPGPVNLVTKDPDLEPRLAQSIRSRAARDGQIELASPDHAALAAIIAVEGGPLLIAPIPHGDGNWATTPTEAKAGAEGKAAVFLEDGICPHGRLPSAVSAAPQGWSMCREGAISADMLGSLNQKLVVFVCTGNTCRSPMAEAIFKRCAADRLGCTVEELPARGIVVRSAGLSAIMGFGAAREAQETVQDLGATLDRHQSQPLSRELACEADLLLAMTRSHLRQIEDRFGHLGVQGRLLSPSGEDIADPIGNDLSVYRSCAAEIQKALETVLPEVLT